MRQQLRRVSAYLLWLGTSLAFAAALLAERLLKPVCELRVGSSIFGEDTYTLLGQTCTYTLGGQSFALRPSPARVILPLLLAAWLLSLVLLDRRAGRRRGDSRG